MNGVVFAGKKEIFKRVPVVWGLFLYSFDMKPENKIIPVFQTDAQMGAFLETVDLSEYDLSGFTPVVLKIAALCTKKEF